jgi:hypothetical protein
VAALAAQAALAAHTRQAALAAQAAQAESESLLQEAVAS